MLHKSCEVSIHLLHAPYQFLKPLLRQLVVNSRMQAAASTRTLLGKAQTLDMHALHSAFSRTKKPCSELGQLKWLLSQSYWSNDKLQMVGRYCTNACECGHTPQNFLHIIYDCPLLSDKRSSFKWLKGFLDCNPT